MCSLCACESDESNSTVKEFAFWCTRHATALSSATRGSLCRITQVYHVSCCVDQEMSLSRTCRKCSAIGNVPLKDKNFSRSPGNQNRRFHGTSGLAENLRTRYYTCQVYNITTQANHGFDSRAPPKLKSRECCQSGFCRSLYECFRSNPPC